jgi:cellulose synthase/poly-beta-1,6-N-acetylglucosamine synthase-like glycosyltransferase
MSKTEERPELIKASRAAQRVAVPPPLVSVIITNFNYGRFIRAAVQSVEAQTYQRWECIIVDDCSTDGSFEAISDYLAHKGDDRLRPLRMAANSGQLASSAAGLKAASGSFVVFLDADDYLLPDFLEVHVRCHLNSAHSAGLTASDMLTVDAGGNTLEGTFAGINKTRLDQNGVVPAGELPELSEHAELLFGNEMAVQYVSRWHQHSFAATSSIMFRRAVLELILPNESEFGRLHADYYFALFAHLISGTLVISSFHSAYRVHGANGFSKAVLGGGNFVGVFDEDRRSAIERAISYFVIDNYGTLATRVHPSTLSFIAGRFLRPWEMLERARTVPAAKSAFLPGSSLRNLLRRVYHRLRR